MTVTTLAPTITVSADPLAATATALETRSGTLYLGLPDGGIAIRGGDAAKGIAIRPPQPAGAVKSIAVSGDGQTVYWITVAGGSRVYACQVKERALHTYDPSVDPAGGTAPEAIATLPAPSGHGETIALLGNGMTRFFDAASGRMRTATDALPADAAEMLDHPMTSLFTARDPARGGRAALLIVSGDSVAPGVPAKLGLWTSHGGAWTRRDLDATTAPPFSQLRYRDVGRAAVSLTPAGFGLLTPPAGGQTLAAARVWTATWEVTDGNADQTLALHPYGTLPEGVSGLWAAPERVSLGRSGLWWTFGNSVFHTILSDGKTEAYLPWNGGAGAKNVSALLADDNGVWVATDAGVRHILPGKQDATKGYGGYVRVRLGTSAGQPPVEKNALTLSRLTSEWAGVPYKWGGDTKAGIDCSGYICALYQGVGIPVPRATNELAGGDSGKRIHDDLKYGDVLVFPGHCAFYTGNGWTSEAMKETGVGKATIWSRTPTVVRRFLQ
jgi:cell wall-associated NlpC family hydrolase